MRIRLWVLLMTATVLAARASGGDDTIAELLARGDSLAKAANFDSAIVVESRALAMAEGLYGPVDTTVAQALVQLGIANFYQANYAASKELWSRAHSIYEEVLGPDHPETAHAMKFMGIYYDQMGQPARAVTIFQEAIAIFDAADDPDPGMVADCLHNLAISYYRLGQLDLAKENYERALVLYEEDEGPISDDVAGCIANLGLIYYETGDYAQALGMYERALEIQEETLGPDHPDGALARENIANIYVVLRRYPEAETQLKRALEIKRATYNARHPEIANAEINLASLYVTVQRYDEAKPLLTDALSILEDRYGPDHADVSYVLANLARIYAEEGQYDKAEEYYLRVLAIREKQMGRFHTKVAMTLNNLGVMYQSQGRDAEAFECYKRALDINEKVLTERHPSVADILGNIATMCRQDGKADSAYALYGRACAIYQDNLIDNGWVLPEADALSYAQEVGDIISKYVSAYLELGSSDPAALEAVSDAILRGKGQVSDVMFERARVIVTETDPEVRALADSLRQHKEELSRLWVQGAGASISKYNSQVKSLSKLIGAEETRLAEESASFQKWRDSKKVSLVRVRSLVPEDAVLVEYYLYQRVQVRPFKVVPAYAALVVRPDGVPAIVELGEAAQIDSMIGLYRRHFREVASLGAPNDADLADYRALADDIYARVWLPIEEFVAGSDLVLVCPDAALSLVSFAALPAGSGGYLIERHALHYLSSGRDLIRLGGVLERAEGLLAFGDPDYGLAGQGEGGEPALTRGRGALPDCEGFRNMTVNPLPGTRREVEQIVAAWKELQKERRVVHLGKDASEEAFKKDAPGMRVIHLATHGYYVGGECGSNRDNTVGAGGFLTNPLLLSGLFLAGANRRAERTEAGNGQDGVVTAFEVSSMNLMGCDLVVLSACETGLGEPEDGEGVYGLRRAFHMAGAATVVSALWEITDEDAARFASRLYARDDDDLPYRLQALQLELLADLRATGQPDHPFSWAAFIAQGAW